MRFKKFMATGLAAAMAVSMAACGGSSASSSSPAVSTTGGNTSASVSGDFALTDSDPDVNIILAHCSAEDTAVGQGALKFKDLVEQYSGGKMTVDVYPNSTLATVAELNENIKDNTVQVLVGTPTSGLCTGLGFFELPNLVTSMEQSWELCQDPDFISAINDICEPNQIHMLSMAPGGFRVLTSNKEVRSYADIAGLKIRTMDSEVPMSYWKQWKASPTPLAWGEVYTSLQQGLVEAQENPYDSIIAANLQEVQKYVVNTNHVMFYTSLMMSNQFYTSLTDNERALIDKVGEDVSQFAYEYAQESNEKKLQTLIDSGMEYIELTDDDYNQMYTNSSNAQQIVKDAIGEDSFNNLMAAVGREPLV